jgi:hypothetical protein
MSTKVTPYIFFIVVGSFAGWFALCVFVIDPWARDFLQRAWQISITRESSSSMPLNFTSPDSKLTELIYTLFFWILAIGVPVMAILVAAYTYFR